MYFCLSCSTVSLSDSKITTGDSFDVALGTQTIILLSLIIYSPLLSFAQKEICPSPNTFTFVFPEHHLLYIFMYLVESWHQLPLKDPSTFVSIPPAWEFLFCIESLLDYICEEDRYPLLNAGFKNHDVDIVNIALILSELEKQHSYMQYLIENKMLIKQKTFLSFPEFY